MDKELKIFCSDTDHVIAYDLDDANAVLCEAYGLSMEELLASDSAITGERTSSDPITITDIDGCNGPEHTTHTPAEWIALEGRGLLCTTELLSMMRRADAAFIAAARNALPALLAERDALRTELAARDARVKELETTFERVGSVAREFGFDPGEPSEPALVMLMVNAYENEKQHLERIDTLERDVMFWKCTCHEDEVKAQLFLEQLTTSHRAELERVTRERDEAVARMPKTELDDGIPNDF